jgi:hypothetical protein
MLSVIIIIVEYDLVCGDLEGVFLFQNIHTEDVHLDRLALI